MKCTQLVSGLAFVQQAFKHSLSVALTPYRHESETMRILRAEFEHGLTGLAPNVQVSQAIDAGVVAAIKAP